MADITISKFRTTETRSGASPSNAGFPVSEGQDPVNPPGQLTDVFVPYEGALKEVKLGEQGLSTGFVTLDTTPTGTPTTQGTMFWDEDDDTVDIVLNGYIMKVGEDLFYPVKNQTGSNIAKGVAVRFAGTVGASGRLLIAPFIADGSVASSRFMGVTAEAIDNGEDGKVLWFGRIRGINTNAFNEGDILYASTTSAGGFQTAIPVAPNNIVQVAAVVTKSTTNGVIFVRPTLGSNINKDEGVKIVSPATGDLLERQSNGLFENRTKAAMGLHTGVLTANYIPKATGASTLGDSVIYETGANILIGGTVSDGRKFQVIGSDITVHGITVGRGADNVATNTVIGSGAAAVVTGSGNSTVIGYQAAGAATGIYETIAIGYQAAYNLTGGGGTIFIGRQAGYNSTGPVASIFIGESSGRNTTGDRNVFIGHFSGSGNTSGQLNVSMGYESGRFLSTGIENTVIGGFSGFNLSATTGNTFLGYDSGRNINTGNYNVALGHKAGEYKVGLSSLTNSSNSIFIGYRAKADDNSQTNQIVIGHDAVGLGSNTIVLGNSSITDNYISGNFNIGDAKNLIIGTTTGTKIGTATTQKISLWNATPIVQPTTAITESAFVENSGGVNVNDDSTFDGYTLRQVVKALRDVGLLA
jgi:hypothetical protein